jgi:hypothetical protein
MKKMTPIVFIFANTAISKAQDVNLENYFKNAKNSTVSKQLACHSVVTEDGKDTTYERSCTLKKLRDNYILEFPDKVICTNQHYSFVLKKNKSTWVLNALYMKNDSNDGFLETCYME